MSDEATAIVFPRYREDIDSRRRTLFHSCEEHSVGGRLILVGNENSPRGYSATITSAMRVRLRQLDAADLEKLGGVTADEYLARWDAGNPQCLSVGDPEVWRIEFKYGRTSVQ